MRVLVLGHRGMLGHTVSRYLKRQNVDVDIIFVKWPSSGFYSSIRDSNADFLINCIGAIPQKGYDWYQYKSINIDLPRMLGEIFHNKIIHPGTDCEFEGREGIIKKNDPPGLLSEYGLSKKYASEYLYYIKNVKQIRTSIIGPELKSHKSLFDWFVRSNQSSYDGYCNHYWNGITSLEWAKQAYMLMSWWDMIPDKIIQIGQIDRITKYDLLNTINKVYQLKKRIVKTEASNTVHRVLETDVRVPDIAIQLEELKEFYGS